MPKVMKGWGRNADSAVVSLCDFSGNWPRPWNETHGYTVIHYDLKHGDDVTGLTAQDVMRDVGNAGAFIVALVLAAPPCTDFTVSGAQWWPAKDADGRTEASLRVLDACVRLCKTLHPTVGWALENPVGRLPKLRPELGKPTFYFDPHEYAWQAPEPTDERYTKRTGIWTSAGLRKPVTDAERRVQSPLHPAPLAPIMHTTRDGKRGSWMWAKLGGKSERTKELRSMTPMGFARAMARDFASN